MTVPIFWLSNHDEIDAIGPWDTGLLLHLFEGKLGRVGVEFTSAWANERTIPDGIDVGVVVLPARHHYSDDDIHWLNHELNKMRAGLLILCGDEDAGFPWKKLRHPNLRFWVQMPDPRNYADMSDWAFFFGNGWRYEFPERVAANRRPASMGGDRQFEWAFAGQITNAARRRAEAGLRRASTRVPGSLLGTEGFAQGVDGQDYADLLTDTWVAPCPGGPKSVDTFRLYEALEAGAVPLVEYREIEGQAAGYWDMVYGAMPFQRVDDWGGVGGQIEEILQRRHFHSAVCSSWWQRHKRSLVARMEGDLAALGVDVEQARLTVVVTTSPVPSNPSLGILLETLASIPEQFEVVVAADGVRPEQAHLAEPYDLFLYRLSRWCEAQGARVTPHIEGQWRHQAGTTAAVLNEPGLVRSKAILFMEHDTPLVSDEPIDWDACLDLVVGGHVDVLRFHHEGVIQSEHEHLMIDHSTRTMLGVPLRRTRQWSQRPHLADTDYYRRILRNHFPPTARTMIEDRMHSVAQTQMGHRLALYHPDGNIKRSYHLDGRETEPKFDMKFGD